MTNGLKQGGGQIGASLARGKRNSFHSSPPHKIKGLMREGGQDRREIEKHCRPTAKMKENGGGAGAQCMRRECVYLHVFQEDAFEAAKTE